MKKLIIGATAVIMLAGASVYAANSVNKKSETKKECKACPGCSDCDACPCGESCSK